MTTNGKQLNTLVSEAHKEALKRVAHATYASEGAIVRDLILFADQVAAGSCPPFPEWLKQAQDIALEANGAAPPAVSPRPAVQAALPSLEEQEAFAIANGYSFSCDDGCCDCIGDCDQAIWVFSKGTGPDCRQIGASYLQGRASAVWIAYALAKLGIAPPPEPKLPLSPGEARDQAREQAKRAAAQAPAVAARPA